MDKKIVVWGDANRAYDADVEAPMSVLVPKGKEHLLPEGTPYIRILGKGEKVNENGTVTKSDFNVTENIVTFDSYIPFCIDTGRDIPHDQDWGKGQRPIININAIDVLHFVNWIADQCQKLQEKTGIFGENVVIVKPYILQRTQSGSEWLWMNPEILELKSEGFDVKYPSIPLEKDWPFLLADAPQQAAKPNNLKNIAWYSENSNQMTHPVREKKPNSIGIYDILGNVWKMVLEKEPPYMTPELWKEKKFPGEYMSKDMDWYGDKHRNTPVR